MDLSISPHTTSSPTKSPTKSHQTSASSPRPATRPALLRKCAHAFCKALQSAEFDASNFIDTFMVPSNPRITEHGPPCATATLPFLATAFQGQDGCLRYFEKLGSTLKMRLPQDAFPPEEQFVVDPDAENEGIDLGGCVCVTGKGRFENRASGRGWDEVFIYKLSGFDEDGRVAHWEIWADPLSAWLSAQPDKEK